MPESKPHLFISHATWRANENQRVTQILDCLFAVLDKEWDVFVDKKRLDPGVKWRPEILHRLSNAQAGIVLFDQRAVNESDWVKSEALIMCFRKSIDPDFQLIPVLLEGVTPDDEELSIYKPFQLGEITFKHDDKRKTPGQISAEIKKALNVEKAKSTKPFRGWMWEFEGLLLNIHSTTLL
ncbi:MAG TPA: toll/interleukin-1 receptor domain-containing protein, partial [Pyrinomonadaceae bacterium]|nr:toll/interleukin-1 receptor domain-containing protein [Pyrinomonadaceae bacterium]